MDDKKKGYRDNVGIILLGPPLDQTATVLLCRRIGQNAWQFPQGGINPEEKPEEALFRELYEEIGLKEQDVTIVKASETWYYYDLPSKYQHRRDDFTCLGQRQKWFLLSLAEPGISDKKIAVTSGERPEFDSWLWVDYKEPLNRVIEFKREVYEKVLEEFADCSRPT